MAFLMAKASKTNVHSPATYMMNSGFLTTTGTTTIGKI